MRQVAQISGQQTVEWEVDDSEIFGDASCHGVVSDRLSW